MQIISEDNLQKTPKTWLHVNVMNLFFTVMFSEYQI